MRFKKTITRTSKVEWDARLEQVNGIFDLPPGEEQTLRWEIDLELPDDFSVIAIVGGSGSGKTTIARELAALFGARVIESKDEKGNLKEPFAWDRNKAIASAMPEMDVREWTGLLSSVGFSSPPAWQRPYQVLSNGQQFRANLARAIAEAGDTPVIFDEFASLVHDQVAIVASMAVTKAIRRMKKRLIVVTWRTDILSALEPDAVIFVKDDQTVQLVLNSKEGISNATASRDDSRRWVRPAVELKIIRTDHSTWDRVKAHHYLSHTLHRGAKCFAGLIGGELAAFTAVLSFPHPHKPSWRESRTVCLPDFQGAGIGNAMSEAVAAMFAATGKPYTSTTSHPAMIRHRAKSPLWKMTRRPNMEKRHSGRGSVKMAAAGAIDRLTAGFEYCGPLDLVGAKRFGLL